MDNTFPEYEDEYPVLHLNFHRVQRARDHFRDLPFNEAAFYEFARARALDYTARLPKDFYSLAYNYLTSKFCLTPAEISRVVNVACSRLVFELAESEPASTRMYFLKLLRRIAYGWCCSVEQKPRCPERPRRSSPLKHQVYKARLASGRWKLVGGEWQRIEKP